MFNVVCFDLDGTLLNSDKKISESDREAIKELKKNKSQIVLVSGRHVWEITEYARELELSGEDFIISCDGQYICDSFGNVLWKNSFLSKRDVLWLVRNVSTVFSIFTNIRDYKLKGSFGYKSFLRLIKKQQKKKEKISLIELLLLPGLKIEKIVLINPTINSIKRKRFSVRVFNGERIELTNSKVDKYIAIKQLYELGYIIEDSSILYFGDEVNDIMCFENLDYCVAMGNAIPEIKGKAVFITKDCDNSGISFALERIKGIKN